MKPPRQQFSLFPDQQPRLKLTPEDRQLRLPIPTKFRPSGSGTLNLTQVLACLPAPAHRGALDSQDPD